MFINLRFGLVVLAAIIIFVVLLDALRSRMASRKIAKVEDVSSDEESDYSYDAAELPVITVRTVDAEENSPDITESSASTVVEDYSQPHQEEWSLDQAEPSVTPVVTQPYSKEVSAPLKAQASPSVNNSINVAGTLANSRVNQSSAASAYDDILMISLHAKPHRRFTDYSFVQTLGSVGLSYGEKNIFHYYRVYETGSECLFSVANLEKPGTFNLDRVESINSRGILLFIDFKSVADPAYALHALMEAVHQLAEDLEGDLFEAYNIPWQEDTEQRLIASVTRYQQREASTHGSTEFSTATN